MPIIIYSGTLGPGKDRTFLLSDIGRFSSSGKSSLFINPQWHYISKDGHIVLKSTNEVEQSISSGVIRGFIETGVLSVEYLPYIETTVSSLTFYASLDNLAATPDQSFVIKNIGDDPATGGPDIPFAITNSTAVAATEATLVGFRKHYPYNIAPDGGSAVISGKKQPYNLTVATPPTLISTNAGPYTIVGGVNDVIRIRYSNLNYPLKFINLAIGTRTTAQIAAEINAVLPGLASATAAPNGFLQLQGLSNGSNINILVGSSAQGSTANTTLGFPAAGVTTSGTSDINTLQFTIDGVLSTVPVTQGAARTAAQVAADINVVFPGTASAFNGYVMVSSTTTGPTSSVEVETANANNTIGFVAGTLAQGYVGNEQFTLKVNGGSQSITLTTGSRTPAQIANDILVAAIPDLTAAADGDYLRISTIATGLGKTLEITTDPLGSTAYAQLGFAIGDQNEGSDALANFITLSSTMGNINQVQWATITASLNTAGISASLSPGIFTGYLIIGITGAFNAPVHIPVTLVLTATS